MKINPLHVSVLTLVMAGALSMAPLGSVHANDDQKTKVEDISRSEKKAPEASEAKRFEPAEKFKAADDPFKLSPKKPKEGNVEHFTGVVGGESIKIDIDHDKGTVKTDSTAAVKAIIDKTLSSGDSGPSKIEIISQQNEEALFMLKLDKMMPVIDKDFEKKHPDASLRAREKFNKRFEFIIEFMENLVLLFREKKPNVTLFGLAPDDTQNLSRLIKSQDFLDKVNQYK
ncbi:MAG TPA: hypothetical protein PLY23_04315 [Alphaproteobacteria bacterium]|nr:hypothetical protein [Alphaproteobacteria bacterium]HQS93991.1 hypothetical protein [Alphaproteobacteria bacterium]